MKDDSIYADARRYDLMTSRFASGEELEFYLRQARKYGEPVLELGCGTGRLTIPLAEQGVAITGLDRSSIMLAYAQEKAAAQNAAVTWVEGDCRAFDLDKPFGLIFFPNNALLHLLALPDLEACFACVRQHLKATGAFVFEIFSPALELLTRDPNRRYPVGEYQDPDRNCRFVVTESNRYDASTQINHIRWFYRYEDSTEETSADLDLRMLFPQEIDALLHCNGLRIEGKYGDYAETPFVSASRRQLLICSPED